MDTKFKPKDLKNQKFGKLTAISVADKRSNKNEYYWNCICDCGKHCLKRTSTLTSKRGVKSCGCAFYEFCKRTGKESSSWKGYNDITGTYYRRLIEGSLKRNIEFKLTIEDIWELYISQDKKCAYTGKDIYFDSPGYLNRYTGNLSLDRIDSTIGYVKGNIQLVLKEVNIAKGQLKHEDFINMCKLITEYKKGFLPGGGIRDETPKA